MKKANLRAPLATDSHQGLPMILRRKSSAWQARPSATRGAPTPPVALILLTSIAIPALGPLSPPKPHGGFPVFPLSSSIHSSCSPFKFSIPKEPSLGPLSRPPTYSSVSWLPLWASTAAPCICIYLQHISPPCCGLFLSLSTSLGTPRGQRPLLIPLYVPSGLESAQHRHSIDSMHG